jgi:hypothetical protein
MVDKNTSMGKRPATMASVQNENLAFDSLASNISDPANVEPDAPASSENDAEEKEDS